MTQIITIKQNTQSIFTNSFTVQMALEEFSVESLDVSAKGVLRALSSKKILSADELISFMAPRDYDVPVSQGQLELIRKNLESVLNGRR